MSDFKDDSEVAYGCLISTPEGESVNRMMYKMSQNPVNWIRKGFQHQRDAMIMYESSKNMREIVLSKLAEKNFNFGYFYRHDLTGNISDILDENRNVYLPDFEGFYNFIHLSLENFLKGIWLDRNVDLIGFDQLPIQIQTHDLEKLANYTGIKINNVQKDFLRRVYSLYMGYGRYPINVKVKIESDVKEIDFGGRSFETVCFDILSNEYEIDKDNYIILLKKIEKTIQKIFKNEGKYIEKMFKFDEDTTTS